MRRNLRLRATMLVVLALAAGACSKKKTVTIPTANPNIPTQIPSELPSGPPGVTGTITSGEAKLDVTGDVQASFDLSTLSEGILSPPPGGMALTWSDSRSNLLGIGGPSFKGEQKTSNGLILTMTFNGDNGFDSFVSSAGECTITVDSVDANGVSGSFSCAGLSNSGKTIDATGTFEASG